MQVKAFFDEPTFTLTYVVYDPESRDAVVIDPVLDFDPLTWRTSTASAEAVIEFVRAHQLDVKWILDTHAHADHLTGMDALKHRLEAPTAIGERITLVQETFKQIYHLGDVPTDGRQFDALLGDGEVLPAGSFAVKALHTPGHTPACMSYLIGDMVFTGDALFMPDYGTGRCDFPRGDAEALYDSVTTKLYTLPAPTRVFVGHDYLPGGRELAYETTIGDSLEHNVQLRAGTTKADFVAFRHTRDSSLAPPKLILQSLQVNIVAGRLPSPEDNGVSYFKIPINFLGRPR
ncbi:MBL fold metallo-hydrolase [Haliangium sp.]|uniref:MBL fold metallo-hydrolase n=1 Tax=Haliangium sp. TaxID=2663208 RepID=UPI003D1360C9